MVTKFRPVPLTWHFCFARDGAAQLLPLFAGRKVLMIITPLHPLPSRSIDCAPHCLCTT